MSRYGTILLFFILSIASPASVNPAFAGKHRAFIENKGQIIDQNNKPNPAVLYLLNTPGLNVQLRRSGFSYDLYRISNIEHRIQNAEMPCDQSHNKGHDSSSVNFHRIDFDLVGANPACEILASATSSDYLNYYTTGTSVNGATKVRSYENVSYKNIYPGIDLEFQADSTSGVKYNFIVHPGGDLSAIRINIAGAEVDLTGSGYLILKTSVGTIEEKIPESYYLIDSKKSKVHASFTRLGQNIFGLSVNSRIGGATTLVIDPVPNRLWSTYYGGMNANPSSTEAINCIKIDKDGNLVIVGETPSPDNMATAGSFQSTLGGDADAFLAKFTPDGARLWATYYGGSDKDRGVGCAVNALGDIFITGETYSTSQIATPGTYQTTLGGFSDGFAARFFPDGTRSWGTYYGGSESERNCGCTLDKDGNLYTVGQSYSGNNISTPGAYQVGNNGNGDAYLAKFHPDGKLAWGTYYGGNLADLALGVCADTLGNIIMTGNTKSHGDIASPGAHQETYGGTGTNGGGDGFIIRFNTDGQRQWGTYYGGAEGDDATACVCTNSGMIYVTGDTGSDDNISTPGSYQPTRYFGTDAFFVKFTMAGTRIWGTYYGGDIEDHGMACDYDPRGNVFVSGYTASSFNISTPNAYQVYNNGYWDVFLAKFDTNGSRTWCTYFGASWADWCYTLAVDTNDRQYIGGQTGSTTGMASPGAFQTVFGGPYSDGFMAKFTDCVNPHSGPITGKDIVCKNTVETYSIPPIYKVFTYNWAVPPGASILSGQNTATITVSYSNTAIAGKLSVYATNLCGTGDTAMMMITVNANPEPVLTGSNTVCWNTVSTYSTQAGKVNYVWNYSPGGSIMSGGGNNNNTAGISWSTTGSHWVSVTFDNGNGCPVPPATILPVTVQAGPPLNNAPLSKTICSGDSTRILLTSSQAGTTFTWLAAGSSPDVTGFAGGSGDSINQKLVNSGSATTTVTYTITTHFNGCAGLPADYVVSVLPLAPVSVSVTPTQNPVCSGIPVTYTATPFNGGASPSYQWKINGISVGANSNTYSYFPVTGDCITAELTSNTACPTGNPALSNSICMTVNPVMPVSVSITSSGNSVCAGVPVIFTAFPVHQGISPVYQWKVNGVSQAMNINPFTYVPTNGDCVMCELTSDIACATGNPATSNTICVTVDPVLPVSVTVTTPLITVCAGTLVTFTANPAHGGTLPGYQWKVNANNVINANNASYAYNAVDGDVVTCELTSSESCVTGNPALSPPVTMTVNPNLAVSVSITASANPSCSGNQVTFTATPGHGGLVPGYQWKVNAGNVINANNASYAYNAVNGDVVTCELTSSENCVTGNPALSNAITMTVNTNQPAGVSISTLTNPFCPGTAVTITAAPTNGGPAPVYQWKLNGANAGTNLYSFTFNPLAGDSVRCVMTSNLNCVTGNPASSAKIIMTGRAAPDVTFTTCFDTVTILGAQPFKLHGGLPLGGQYSGPGVNPVTGIFTPSFAGTGLKTITYGYSNVYTCLATKTKTILVQPNPSFTCGNNLTDIRDNKIYPTVQIGSQCWMAANLDFGFQISHLTPQTDNCTPEKYQHPASFYQWDELMQYHHTEAIQGLCPPGWHIPSSAEWNALLALCNGPGEAAGPLKDTLLVNGFHSYQQGFLYLNNTWAFTAGLYAGAMYWTSTSSGPDRAVARGLNEYNMSVSLYPSSRGNAFSVRCIKD
ncbi:MAG: FISUMP domain-containing protein [Bacteroidota bacterium]